MNSHLRYLAPAAALLLGVPPSQAADLKPGKPDVKERREMRVLAGPDANSRDVVITRAGGKRGEMELVTFLGVETSPVSQTLTAQLALPQGTGLVINHVVPKSPADGVLQPHDILLKLDDQVLIETRQLAVLIRNRKEGDEVTVTYVRAGQQATARVKLAKHEVPKLSAALLPATRGFHSGTGGFEFHSPAPPPDGEREHVDRVLSLIKPAPHPAPARVQIERRGPPGFRAISVNTGNSNLVFSDDEGSLDLTIKDGVKTLVARNAKGEQVFSGPVTTPAERDAMPAPVRERLERLEGMHEMSFHTDGDFQGAEMKMLPPRGRSISLPAHAPAPRTPVPF